MIKRRFWFLMVLIMAATPVWSAFGYYSGQAGALSAVSSDEQHGAVQHDDHCRHQDKAELSGLSAQTKLMPFGYKFSIDCHASGSCTFHVCGDGGVAPPQLAFGQVYSTHRYEHWQSSIPRSLISSPEIKPPITGL